MKRVAITGKFLGKLSVISGTQPIHFFRKLVRNLSVEPQIFLNFPMIANFPRYAGELLLAERRHVKMFRLNSYAYAWYDWRNLRTIVSCLERQSKLRHFFNGNLPSNNTKKSNQIQHKKFMQTSWFQTNFAVHLWLKSYMLLLTEPVW